MKMITVQIPVDSLAIAVADEIAANRKRGSRCALMKSNLNTPEVMNAIALVIKATDKVDRDQHTRGEAAALTELFSAAKELRRAARFANIVERREKQS
jgi:hypothetical protein